MKIRVLSDLHLEFSPRHPPLMLPEVDADVVVLAGDIDNGTRAIDWAERTFPDTPVLYVPGNHEYYDGEIGEVRAALRARAAQSPNVRVLDNDELVLDGVRFLGSTLWTDFELFGRENMRAAIEDSLRFVVDFRAIRHGPSGRLTPEHTLAFHRAARAFLQERLTAVFPGPTVVITHHAPHPGSVHPRWRSHLSSAAFVSDLTPLLDTPRLWIHGHTHDSFDYEAAGTRIVANPMGYRSSNWREAKGDPARAWVTYENERFDAGLIVRIG
jgi:Icc-related predicted phosphoesterase